MELVMFTKHLKRDGDLSLKDAGDLLVDVGFEGADLTVRPGGYVVPEDAAEALPCAVDLLESKGLSVPMITTALTDAGGDHAEAIFETADACGVPYMKLGYWRYDGFGTIEAGLSGMRADLDDIYELSADYEVTPAVHIHSGTFLSAAAPVLTDLLEDYDPDQLGAYVDFGHMVTEGGLSGWEMGLDLLAEKVRMVAVKDVGWFQTEEGWERRIVPLSEGMVPWSTAFEHLEAVGFDGPVSLHSEYGHLSFDELLKQTREDFAHLEGVVGR